MTAPHPAGSQGMLRAINERALLGLVDRRAPISRVELAALSGLSKPTVSAALASLLEQRAVRETGQTAGRKGPAAVLYGLEPGCARAIAVDLGHDRVRVRLSDALGEAREGREEGVERDAAALAAQVHRLCVTVAGGQRQLDAVTQLVVGVPAAVGPDGQELQHLGMPIAGERLGHLLAEVLPAGLILENDVNLAALAERSLGHGVGVDDFVLVSLGNGLGLGIVMGGRLHRGAAGAAGEAGYLPGPDPGRSDDLVAPRTRETLDATIGARHMEALATRLGLPAGLTVPEIFDLARTGDPRAGEVVEDTARAIAYVIACVAPVLDPALVVLGGAIGSNRDLLLEPVARLLGTLSPLRPRLECSALGSQAVLLGAATMAVELAKEAAFTRLTGAPPAAH